MACTGVKNNVRTIFQNMDTGANVDSTVNAKKWLENNAVSASIDGKSEGEKFDVKDANTGEKLITLCTPSKEAIDKILAAPNKFGDFEGSKRAKLLNSLAAKIEESSSLISELEICARGILAKDTKAKSIALLAESLQYYSHWATTLENSTKSTYLVVTSDLTCLGSLGLILAPALAAGYNVVLQAEPKISVTLSLLIELATKAGFPEGTLQLIPGNVDLNVFHVPSIKAISIFDNIHAEKYNNINCFTGKNYINFLEGKIPMLIFNTADLDSACDAAIDAVWGCQGTLPWSADTILVQEDILEDFVKKLEFKLQNTKMSTGNDKMAELSFPSVQGNAAEKLQKIVKDAALLGIKVIQPNANCNKFQPTLLVGGRVYGNNVIEGDVIDVPVATVLGFRTVNEAANLANNSRQGLGATVWTENIGLANEICKKLNVGTVWINCHALFNASTAFSLLKSSGNGYIGGRQGIKQLKCSSTSATPTYEAPKSKGTSQPPTQSFIGGAFKKFEGKDFNTAVAVAKKGLTDWKKLSPLARNQCLVKLAEQIEALKGKFGEGNADLDKWISDWVHILTQAIITNPSSTASVQTTYDLKSTREALGIVVIEANYGFIQYPMTFIAAALTQGNSIIILNKDIHSSQFFTEMCKTLSSCKIPAGVVNVVMNPDTEATKLAFMHKEVGAYITHSSSCGLSVVNVKDAQKLKIVGSNDCLNSALDTVTYVKNIWTNVGQSFI